MARGLAIAAQMMETDTIERKIRHNESEIDNSTKSIEHLGEMSQRRRAGRDSNLQSLEAKRETENRTNNEALALEVKKQLLISENEYLKSKLNKE